MKSYVLNFFLILFFFSCSTKKRDNSEILARVSGESLTLNKALKLNVNKPLEKGSIPKLVSDWVNNTILLKKVKN